MLNSDTQADRARALHRIVRAMHDGHCPSCGHLGRSGTFVHVEKGGHRCPMCQFATTPAEERDARAAFQPYMRRNLLEFLAWRDQREAGGYVTQAAEPMAKPSESPEERKAAKYQTQRILLEVELSDGRAADVRHAVAYLFMSLGISLKGLGVIPKPETGQTEIEITTIREIINDPRLLQWLHDTLQPVVKFASGLPERSWFADQKPAAESISGGNKPADAFGFCNGVKANETRFEGCLPERLDSERLRKIGQAVASILYSNYGERAYFGMTTRRDPTGAAQSEKQ